MLNLAVSFSAMSGVGFTKEDFEKRLEVWISDLRWSGYDFAVVQVIETVKYEENE